MMLQSVGIFILCVACAIFLLTAALAAYRTERVLRLLEKELPDTAALLRLSGLEVTECVSEITGLGADLSSGIRSTAALVTTAERGLHQGGAVVDQVFKGHVMPHLARAETIVRSECGNIRVWVHVCDPDPDLYRLSSSRCVHVSVSVCIHACMHTRLCACVWACAPRSGWGEGGMCVHVCFLHHHQPLFVVPAHTAVMCPPCAPLQEP